MCRVCKDAEGTAPLRLRVKHSAQIMAPVIVPRSKTGVRPRPADRTTRLSPAACRLRPRRSPSETVPCQSRAGQPTISFDPYPVYLASPQRRASRQCYPATGQPSTRHRGHLACSAQDKRQWVYRLYHRQNVRQKRPKPASVWPVAAAHPRPGKAAMTRPVVSTACPMVCGEMIVLPSG
jgi:hypothetical protein